MRNQATDEIQFTDFMAFDHTAQGAASIPNRSGWMVAVRVQDQNAKAGANVAHQPSGFRPSGIVDPEIVQQVMRGLDHIQLANLRPVALAALDKGTQFGSGKLEKTLWCHPAQEFGLESLGRSFISCF